MTEQKRSQEIGATVGGATLRNGRQAQRYSAGAILLHWLMALLIIWQLWIGIWMTGAINDPETQATAYDAFQFHKSLGLSLLVLAVLRLVWRLAHRVPDIPAEIPGWQRIIARLTHWLLYALMVLIPLSGWIYVSTGWNSTAGMALAVPTVWFGQFEWPHIPGFDGNSAVADLAVGAHGIMAFALIGLLLLHVAAALKHHFADRDDVLWSMLPFVKRPSRTE